jgi:regulator of sigma E protease
VVQYLAEDSAAAEAGIKVGDRIVAIDGDPIDGFAEIAEKVAPFPGKHVVIELERSGDRLTIPVELSSMLERDRFGNEFRIGQLGVGSRDGRLEEVGVGEAFVLAGSQTVQTVDMMVTGIAQIVTGRRSVKELGGPIKIAKFSGEQLSLGWLDFIQFVALISINLAFINLLPIPALDGGHLAFYAAEAVRRKPASPRSQEWAFRTGIALVLALMLFVTVNDVASLFVS